MARAPIVTTVLDPAGNARAGASVEVRRRADNALATVYSGETGSGSLTNPLTTDALGRVSGSWLERGAYKLTISGTGFTTYVENMEASPAADGAVDATWLSPIVLPIGMCVPYAGGADPPGGVWVIADGRALSRTTYAALFALCGGTFGAGDGSTTFNIPNTAGRTVVGAGTAAANGATAKARGALGGEETHTLSAGESGLPAHNPTINDPGHGHNIGTVNDGGGVLDETNGRVGVMRAGGPVAGIQPVQGGNATGLVAKGAATGISSSVGAANAAQAHNTMPPFLVMPSIIRVL